MLLLLRFKSCSHKENKNKHDTSVEELNALVF